MLCAENRREQRHSFETRDNPLHYFLFSSGGGAVNTFICKKKKETEKEWKWEEEKSEAEKQNIVFSERCDFGVTELCVMHRQV